MMLQSSPRLQMVLCGSEKESASFAAAGHKAIRVVRRVADLYTVSGENPDESALEDSLSHEWIDFILGFPAGAEELRDDVAVRLGDTRCRWIPWPKGVSSSTQVGNIDLANLIQTARPMWTDEICTIDDIPEPGIEKLYVTGLDGLDAHGFRLVRPAFMPVIGPYGSGKSVLLRQLAVNLWRLHGWRTLITSFEEKVKPRFHRDLRRHFIGHSMPWTDAEETRADAQIRRAFRFLRRKRNTVLDIERLIDRIIFAVQVHGVEVVMIDPVNEIDHLVPRGESKTDYMGRFIMRLKQLADDYSLLMIVAAHPPKDGVEKRLSKNGLLTLNDGADTAHYGNKADIGWCVWRNLEGPTLLHIDKLKDHEAMGKPTLCELHLDEAMNAFTVGRIGYDILDQD